MYSKFNYWLKMSEMNQKSVKFCDKLFIENTKTISIDIKIKSFVKNNEMNDFLIDLFLLQKNKRKNSNKESIN